MAAPDLEADCTRCAALCCAAFAFEAGHGFGADKPVDRPCPHLAGTLCSIHAVRPDRGYSGCTAYTCHGAGPYVTEIMFEGRGWQKDPALLPAMTRAMRDLARVQELRVLLAAARSLPLAPSQETRRAALARALLPDGDWSQAGLDAFHAGPVPGDVKAFLWSLRALAEPLSDGEPHAPRPAERSDGSRTPSRPRPRQART